MPCSTSDGRLSRDHSVALRTEIGERLRTSMDQAVVAMPPHLQALMKRFGEERGDNGVWTR
ncbi:MAG: hypothetical protein QOI07_3984 [Verrucomicrobiota bacterium]|jgi:hypothetical protein